MKTVVLYESFFGNTRDIALAIRKAFLGEVMIKDVSEVNLNDLTGVEFLIVGSATRGFRPCEKTKSFLKSIPPSGLKGIKVAAFDTRLKLDKIESGALRFMVKTGGYAGKHIARSMQKKGGMLVLPPEGFLVEGEKGPLVTGELERATGWGNKFVKERLI